MSPWSKRLRSLNPGPRLRSLQPTTILSVAVALALVATSGGAFLARATGLWARPAPQVAGVTTAVDVPVAAPAAWVPVAPVAAAVPDTSAPPELVASWPSAVASTAATHTAVSEPTTSASASPTASATVGVPTTTASTSSASTAAPTASPSTTLTLTCSGRAGYDLSLCGTGSQIAAAEVTGALSCASAAACGETGTPYAVTARSSAQQLLVRYYPAFVACLPSSSASDERFDCLRLSGQGESAPRPDNAFLEVWTDGTAVTGRTLPPGCTVSASFTCDGVSVALGSAALSVEYAASSAITCAGALDQSVGAVVVKCGYR